MDTTAHNIAFDSEGECNFCKLHKKMEKRFPMGTEYSPMLEPLVNKIKERGKKNNYDCILGISGGRDSTFLLYTAHKMGLRPLAVHFNDGWGNPICGENMKKVTSKLNIPFRTITSDWRESKDIKIAFLKASVPELDLGTDLGIAATLYSIAYKEKIKTVLIGNSFRTEGIMPLTWSYMDGSYLKSIHNQFGSMKLRPWKPDDPGFNLGVREIFFYTI